MEQTEQTTDIAGNGALITVPTVTAAHEALVLISGKADRACMALSKIQAIKTDPEDEIANNILVKVRKTYEEIMAIRMPLTKILDEAKAKMMEPEKRIDIDAKATASEYNRVKALRNKYATDKEAKAKAERDKLERERKVQDEITRVKAAIKQNIVDRVYDAVVAMNTSIGQYVGDMNLENWDEKEKKFRVAPKLKEDFYNKLFSVQYNASLLSDEVYSGIVKDVQATETFEKVGAEYAHHAGGVIKTWAESLPQKKADLEAIAELGKQNQAQAALQLEKLKEKEAAEQADRMKEAEAAKNKQTAAITQEKEEETLKNTFTQQIGEQSIAGADRVRKTRRAVIVGPDANIVQTLGRILYACYTNPKFKGHVKRNAKTGMPAPPDENGIPVYADWCAELLAFIEKEYDGPAIEGIEFKEVISTIQKAKKKEEVKA